MGYYVSNMQTVKTWVKIIEIQVEHAFTFYDKSSFFYVIILAYWRSRKYRVSGQCNNTEWRASGVDTNS